MANFVFGIVGLGLSGYNLKKEFDKSPEERSGWRIAWDVGSIGLTCITLGTSNMLSSAAKSVEGARRAVAISSLGSTVTSTLNSINAMQDLQLAIAQVVILTDKLNKLSAATNVIGVINTVKTTKDKVEEMNLRKEVESYLPKIEGDDPVYWESAYLNAGVKLIPEEKYDDPLFKKRTWDAPGAAQKLPLRFPVMINLADGAQLYEYSFALLMARNIKNKELEENLWRGIDLPAIKEINERLKEC